MRALFLLTLFSWLQVVLLFSVVHFWCGPPGPPAAELIILLTLGLVGVTTGLAISALSATEEMAITLIPLVVIPQIILSGAICALDGVSKVLALTCVSTYWGKRGLDSCLPQDVAKLVPDLEQNHSTTIAVLVLLIHAGIGVAAALAALYWQNRRGRGLAALLRRGPK